MSKSAFTFSLFKIAKDSSNPRGNAVYGKMKCFPGSNETENSGAARWNRWACSLWLTEMKSVRG